MGIFCWSRDFLKIPKISKEVFEIYKRQFDYEPVPLDIKILKTDNSDPDYTYELIEYNAAYNNERMSGVLFKPKNFNGRLPAIINYPTALSIYASDISEVTLGQFQKTLLKLGHAIFCPIYKGTYNRNDELKSYYPAKTDFYKDHVIMWGKDMKRSIDVIQSRTDLDLSNLMYFGFSWGGEISNIMIPIEPRIKRAVLIVAGYAFDESKPEVEAASYTPFIKVPVLMLNGKYDYIFFDEFQITACQAVEDGKGVLVAAPTGAGKTVVGEFAAFSALAREDEDALVAKLLAAGVETEQAVDLLRSVADDGRQPQYIRDLARLKMASTEGLLTLDEAAAILAELSEPGGVYRNVASELLVAVHLQRGETQAALELLQAHIKDAEAGSEQIQRMAELIVALGASPELAN